MKLGAKEYLIGAVGMWTLAHIIEIIETDKQWRRINDKLDAMCFVNRLLHEEALRAMEMKTNEKISEIYDNMKK